MTRKIINIQQSHAINVSYKQVEDLRIVHIKKGDNQITIGFGNTSNAEKQSFQFGFQYTHVYLHITHQPIITSPNSTCVINRIKKREKVTHKRKMQ